MAPRKPTAERPNMAPAAGRAEQRRPRTRPPRLGAGLERIATTRRAVATRMASASTGDRIAEQDEPEQRDLNRLGLDIRDGDHERASPMAGEHEGVAAIWASAPSRSHAQKTGPGRGRPAPADHHGDQEGEREGTAEQEADMGGADRAERGGELALGGIAHGLRGGRDDGETPRARRN